MYIIRIIFLYVYKSNDAAIISSRLKILESWKHPSCEGYRFTNVNYCELQLYDRKNYYDDTASFSQFDDELFNEVCNRCLSNETGRFTWCSNSESFSRKRSRCFCYCAISKP